MLSITRMRSLVNVRAFRYAVLGLGAALLIALAPLPAHAQEDTYSCGAYGAGSYSTGDCREPTPPQPGGGGTTNGSNNGSSSGLDNTGANVLLIASIGAIILAVAGVVYVKRTSRKRQQANRQP